MKEYIRRISATRLRNKINRDYRGNDYSIVLKDKYIFANYFRGMGLSVPPTVCLISDGEAVYWGSGYRSFAELPASGRQFFCKNTIELCGRSVHHLAWSGNRLFVDGRDAAPDFLVKLKGSWIIQERLKQHDDLKVFKPRGVCSLKLNTIFRDGNVEVVFSFLRIGTKIDYIDNLKTGCCFVRVDTEKGLLEKWGYYKESENTRLSVHPESGIKFEGFKVPMYQKCVELAIRAHRSLPMIRSIGWDVVVTREGPVLLEGNHDWDITTTQILYRRGWKKWFKEAHSRD